MTDGFWGYIIILPLTPLCVIGGLRSFWAELGVGILFHLVVE